MLATLLSPRTLLDPRGRCNRRGLLNVAGLLLLVEVALAGAAYLGHVPLDGTLAMAVKLLLLWTAIAVTAKRLHDCNRSAWWIASGLLGLMGWCFIVTLCVVIAMGPAALANDTQVLMATLIGVFTPLLGLALWLHLVPGETTDNRWGAAPGPSGFSHPAMRATQIGGSVAMSAG
jgi:uncharacterized membrane protein YhaH (DUF805 family)